MEGGVLHFTECMQYYCPIGGAGSITSGGEYYSIRGPAEGRQTQLGAWSGRENCPSYCTLYSSLVYCNLLEWGAVEYITSSAVLLACAIGKVDQTRCGFQLSVFTVCLLCNWDLARR